MNTPDTSTGKRLPIKDFGIPCRHCGSTMRHTKKIDDSAGPCPCRVDRQNKDMQELPYIEENEWLASWIDSKATRGHALCREPGINRSSIYVYRIGARQITERRKEQIKAAMARVEESERNEDGQAVMELMELAEKHGFTLKLYDGDNNNIWIDYKKSGKQPPKEVLEKLRAHKSLLMEHLKNAERDRKIQNHQEFTAAKTQRELDRARNQNEELWHDLSRARRECSEANHALEKLRMWRYQASVVVLILLALVLLFIVVVGVAS